MAKLQPIGDQVCQILEKHMEAIFAHDAARDVTIAIRDHVHHLLKGHPSKLCKCGMEIWFLPRGDGGTTPFDNEGNNHFMTCAKREEFKR